MSEEVGIAVSDLIGTWFFVWGNNRIDIKTDDEVGDIAEVEYLVISMDPGDKELVFHIADTPGKWKVVRSSPPPIILEGYEQENQLVIDYMYLQGDQISALVYETMADSPIHMHLFVPKDDAEQVRLQIESAVRETLER
jgi:hypothetical protein